MKKYLLLIVMLFVGGLPVFAYTQQELLARLTAALREHASSQDSEELLFQRMFAGLDWEVPRSDELQNPVLKKQVSSPVLKPQTQMVEYSSAYESIRDDTSYSSYRSVVEDIVSQYRSPEIGEVRPSTFSTSVDGSHITLHDDLLELYVEIVDDDERHVPADRGYLVVANIGGVYTTLSYQALQQARYLSRQLSLSPNDDVEILLLCEDCGGRGFSRSGPYQQFSVIDTKRFSLDKVKYQGAVLTPSKDGEKYFKQESKSFALTLQRSWVQESQVTLAIDVENQSVWKGVLNTSDISVGVSSRLVPDGQISVQQVSKTLACEDGQGASVTMLPMHNCTLQLVLALPESLRGSQVEFTIKHVGSTNRKAIFKHRVSLPALSK